jgi:hypothetical protein
MKIKALALTALLLAACTPVETKKETGIPPLSAVTSHIRQGMGQAEVDKALAGHKPFLQFTHNSHAVWEIVERINNPKNNSMNANRLTIEFDQDGKVAESSSIFCFLPDLEPMLGKSPETKCYQKQLYPFEKQLTYDAIKRLLIISNYQVDHSDAASEIISATGMHGIEGDKDKMMFIKLSIIFSAPAKSTEVVMSATFSMSEKQSTWVQAGFGGVTLPVPLPFQRTEEWIDSGIVTPKFYLEFYDALSKLIAREYLPYTPITSTSNVPAKPALASPPIPAPGNPASKPIDVYTPTSPKSNNTLKAFDAELENLQGPIDGSTPPKNLSPKEAVVPEENDIFMELKGKPIDSDKLKK